MPRHMKKLTIKKTSALCFFFLAAIKQREASSAASPTTIIPTRPMRGTGRKENDFFLTAGETRHRKGKPQACQKESEVLVIKELPAHPRRIPQAKGTDQLVEGF